MSSARRPDPWTAADLGALRAAVVEAGRRLGARGLIVAAEGNLSVRLPDARILVTPSGLRKDELRPDDLLVVPIGPGAPPGAHPGGLRPTSDLAIHRALYAARPDVMAVAHAHVPASMALTLAGLVPDPAALPETAFHLPRLPLVPYAEMGSEELAGRIAAAMTEPPRPLPVAALLERHGAVAIGSAPPAASGEAADADPELARHGLELAVQRLELVDVLCRVWRDAILLRAAAARP